MKIQDVAVKDIVVVENHRVDIKKTRLDELMLNIKQHGVQEPIGVARAARGKFELVFGHRRLLAVQQLGWSSIPAQIIEGADGKKKMLLNLTENIQRKDPSFAEIGRGIEKLEKMNLTSAEIAARLGIPERRVKKISTAYKNLPAKHRDKVEFMGKGKSNRNGCIPPGVANAIIRAKKTAGLSDKHCDRMVESVMQHGLDKEDLELFSMLLSTGMKYDEAMEKLSEFHIYTISVVAPKTLVVQSMAESGCKTKKEFFLKIIYGQIKGIPKPRFIKF